MPELSSNTQDGATADEGQFSLPLHHPRRAFLCYATPQLPAVVRGQIIRLND